jgi:2-oxoglutarate dehydrogenase E2 component (dihydrolipoamide succinyltransferase)
MAIPINVPTVGESITEVTIANWLKKDGDTVAMDEVIAELESDKATFELTAPSAGVLRIKESEGATVSIGALICEVEPGDAPAEKKTEPSEKKTEPAEKKTEPAAQKTSAAPKPTGGTKEMKVPAVGESIT